MLTQKEFEAMGGDVNHISSVKTYFIDQSTRCLVGKRSVEMRIDGKTAEEVFKHQLKNGLIGIDYNKKSYRFID